MPDEPKNTAPITGIDAELAGLPNPRPLGECGHVTRTSFNLIEQSPRFVYSSAAVIAHDKRLRRKRCYETHPLETIRHQSPDGQLHACGDDPANVPAD